MSNEPVVHAARRRGGSLGTVERVVRSTRIGRPLWSSGCGINVAARCSGVP